MGLACYHPELKRETNLVYETILTGYRATVWSNYNGECSPVYSNEFKTIIAANKWATDKIKNYC